MILQADGTPYGGKTCDHTSIKVSFDEQAAAGLDASEVKRRWPRFSGRCPGCGVLVIMYASYAHYITGDW